MARNKPRRTRARTEFVVPDEPNWDPLERAVVRWLAGRFMAMGEVVLNDGAHVCCYKHCDTRRSLHLDADLNAYLYSFDDRSRAPGWYERVSLDEALSLVVLQPEFEDGWIERGRFDRPWRVDEEGNEVERDEDDIPPVTYWEVRMAEEAWQRGRAWRSEVAGGEDAQLG